MWNETLKRRKTTDKFIDENLKQAAKWDPTDASYEKFSYRNSWGWGGGGYSARWEAAEWNADSQRRWRTRTDACAHFLKRALKGFQSMKRHDKEAEKLGLDTSYKPGEIDAAIEDLKTKIVALKKNRKRKS